MKKFFFIVLSACAFGVSASAESGLRLGGSWGVGSAARYKGSSHGSLFFGWNIGEQSAAGVDLLFDTQHIAHPSSDVGATGKEHYDAKINVGALTAYARHAIPMGDALAVSGVLGAGVYQINTFQGCRNNLVGFCSDHHGLIRTQTDNRFGVNGGVGLLFRPSKSVSIGPEVRWHQILGGGRQPSPALVTGSLLLIVHL